jgi:hypothetical protein
MLSFGQQEHIPIGIDYIDAAAFQKQIVVRLRDRTVGDVLDALTRPGGYWWSTDGQVVTVTHDGALGGKKNLLNSRIPSFRIGETTMHEADLALHLSLHFLLSRRGGDSAWPAPKIPLMMRNYHRRP